jgi:hypothetical protein
MLPLERMMCTVLWKMEKTSKSSAQTGSMLTCGNNGVTLGLSAFHKVCKLCIYMYIVFNWHLEPVEEPVEEAHEKTNAKPTPFFLMQMGFQSCCQLHQMILIRLR